MDPVSVPLPAAICEVQQCAGGGGYSCGGVEYRIPTSFDLYTCTVSTATSSVSSNTKSKSTSTKSSSSKSSVSSSTTSTTSMFTGVPTTVPSIVTSGGVHCQHIGCFTESYNFILQQFSSPDGPTTMWYSLRALGAAVSDLPAIWE